MKEQINETMELVNTPIETRTKFTDKFSQEIFDVTYAYGKENIDDCHSRVARDLASVEKEELRDEWTKNFEWLLKDFKFVPGGRILSNAGTGLKGTSYINCFVSGFQGENQDSMLSILDELRRQAMILKSEGGYGINIDVLRPRGGFIDGIGNESPGAVKMLDMWDTQSAVITSGSGRKSNKSKAKIKIRKGAQMVTMSCFSSFTEVLTSTGWLNIVDVITRLENSEELFAVTRDGEKKMSQPIVREPEPIFEVETEDGETIQVTADHEFEVRNIKTQEIYLKKLCEIDVENEEVTIFRIE